MSTFANPTAPRLMRVASMLLPLGVGILIGAVWCSSTTSTTTAQTPQNGLETASQPRGGQFTTLSTEPASTESAPPGFGAIAGERVTVVEARGGRDVAGSGGLIGFSHVDGAGTQVITLVDAEKLWMAVYHMGSDGKIRLVSSREIAADFTLQLNATAPLPDQIRRLQGIPPRSK